MNTRPLAVVAGAALVLPAAVLADGLGPHTSYYNQHPGSSKPQNDVSLAVHRDKHKADIFVQNSCLGSSQFGGSQPQPNLASARGVRVHNGKIAFDGKATIFKSDGQEQTKLHFTATITRKKATGTAKFPAKPCKAIPFTAKLVSRTK